MLTFHTAILERGRMTEEGNTLVKSTGIGGLEGVAYQQSVHPTHRVQANAVKKYSVHKPRAFLT